MPDDLITLECKRKLKALGIRGPMRPILTIVRMSDVDAKPLDVPIRNRALVELVTMLGAIQAADLLELLPEAESTIYRIANELADAGQLVIKRHYPEPKDGRRGGRRPAWYQVSHDDLPEERLAQLREAGQVLIWFKTERAKHLAAQRAARPVQKLPKPTPRVAPRPFPSQAAAPRRARPQTAVLALPPAPTVQLQAPVIAIVPATLAGAVPSLTSAASPSSQPQTGRSSDAPVLHHAAQSVVQPTTLPPTEPAALPPSRPIKEPRLVEPADTCPSSLIYVPQAKDAITLGEVFRVPAWGATDTTVRWMPSGGLPASVVQSSLAVSNNQEQLHWYERWIWIEVPVNLVLYVWYIVRYSIERGRYHAARFRQFSRSAHGEEWRDRLVLMSLALVLCWCVLWAGQWAVIWQLPPWMPGAVGLTSTTEPRSATALMKVMTASTAMPGWCERRRITTQGGARVHLRAAPGRSAPSRVLLDPGTSVEVFCGDDRKVQRDDLVWVYVHVVETGLPGWVAELLLEQD